MVQITPRWLHRSATGRGCCKRRYVHDKVIRVFQEPSRVHTVGFAFVYCKPLPHNKHLLSTLNRRAFRCGCIAQQPDVEEHVFLHQPICLCSFTSTTLSPPTFQGNYSEAGPLYRRAAATFEAVLGREHPIVAAALNNLAGMLRMQVRAITPCQEGMILCGCRAFFYFPLLSILPTVTFRL